VCVDTPQLIFKGARKYNHWKYRNRKSFHCFKVQTTTYQCNE